MPLHVANGHGKGTTTWHTQTTQSTCTKVLLVASRESSSTCQREEPGDAAEAVSSLTPRLVAPVSFATIPMLATYVRRHPT